MSGVPQGSWHTHCSTQLTENGPTISLHTILGVDEMGKVGKKFVLLLDVDRVLAALELRAAEALAATGPEGEGHPAEVVGSG
jgi:hypothetical protein